MKGMSAKAADLYYALPVWMKLAFAVGSGGGLIGSIALGTRRHIAVPIFVASLVGYLALFAGDHAYGVFDAIPGQMTVLLIVVAVAIALLLSGIFAERQRLLL